MADGAVHDRDNDPDQRRRVLCGLHVHQGHERREPVPFGVLHAEPHRRHCAGLHLAAAAQRRAGPLGALADLLGHLRLLGHGHPGVLAADRLHDGHLHRRPAGPAHRRHGGRRRGRRQLAPDPVQSHPAADDAQHHRLLVPDRDQRLQALRPEPGSDQRCTEQHERDAGAEHLPHVLRTHRLRGRRPGQGRGVLHHRGRDRRHPEQADPPARR